MLPRGAAVLPRTGARHHRQRIVGRHSGGQPGSVRGGQGRGQRAHGVARARIRTGGHSGGRDRPRRDRRPGATHRARPDRREDRAGKGVVPGDRRSNDRLVAAAPLRNAGRRGRTNPFPGLGRGVVHHRNQTPGRRWRPRLNRSDHHQGRERQEMTEDYVMAPSATLGAAQRAIAAAIDEAEALAVDVCIAVTDGAGSPARDGPNGPRPAAVRPDRPGQGLFRRVVRRPADQRLVANARIRTRPAARHRQDRSTHRLRWRGPAGCRRAHRRRDRGFRGIERTGRPRRRGRRQGGRLSAVKAQHPSTQEDR